MSRRSHTLIWLLDEHPLEDIKGSRLPSLREVLRYFFYRHSSLGETVRNAARAAVEKTTQFWDKAGIPHHVVRQATDNLVNVFLEWCGLRKNRAREGIHAERRRKFCNKIDQLFDMAPMGVMNKIKIPEDKIFLEMQRKHRKTSSMLGVDSKLALKNKRKRERDEAAEAWRQKYISRNAAKNESIAVDLDDEDDKEETVSQLQGHSSRDDFEIERKCEKNVRRSESRSSSSTSRSSSVLSPEVCLMADRRGISNCDLTRTAATIVKTVTGSLDKVTLSVSTVRRERLKHRTQAAADIKKSLEIDGPIVLHWDGKIMKDITGCNEVDRLPIVVTSGHCEQLLGSPIVPQGTGAAAAQGKIVARHVKEWSLEKQVRGLCFDTPTVNTGPKNGVCVTIERELETDLLWFACRHHIHELLLEVATDHTGILSAGPDMKLFERFRKTWGTLDRESWKSGISEELLMTEVPDVDPIVVFCQQQLTVHHPREDSRELLELAIMFLGGIPPGGVRIKQPGAVNKARWMGKAIYSLKMSLYREVLSCTARERKAVLQISVFVVSTYIKYWYTCPVATMAPRNDLELLKILCEKGKNNAMYKKISEKFSCHLWYLSTELVGLAFFDPEVSRNMKREMAAAFTERESEEEPPKRVSINLRGIADLQLDDFVSQSTKRFFDILGISCDFISKDVDSWDSDENFKSGLNVVRYLSVVNDCAERAVALMKFVNGKLTKNEEQVQCVLQVTAKNRKDYPTYKKSDLNK